MKTLTVRLPDEIVADITAESEERNVSKSDVVRERLQAGAQRKRGASQLNGIADLVGSVDGLPEDLSARRKNYLRTTGYGRKPSR
jgi:hypothetical protein